MRFRNRSLAGRHAARCRWRAAEARAQAERDDGIPDREPLTDCRDPIDLDLTSYGGPRLHIVPRAGYIACRALDLDTGEVECAALKTLLHSIADRLPRHLSPRRAGLC
jgi:hypothetical protein